jgi:pyroglutamyl-peptidase
MTDGQDTLSVSLPVNIIVARLNRVGIPVAVSDDAGAYLCNALLYRSLQLAADNTPPTRAGFIHMPPQYSAHFTAAMALDGALEIVRASLGLKSRAITDGHPQRPT